MTIGMLIESIAGPGDYPLMATMNLSTVDLPENSQQPKAAGKT
jgi:hypothetical protein